MAMTAMTMLAKSILIAGMVVPLSAQTGAEQTGSEQVAAHARAAQQAERRNDFHTAVFEYGRWPSCCLRAWRCRATLESPYISITISRVRLQSSVERSRSTQSYLPRTSFPGWLRTGFLIRMLLCRSWKRLPASTLRTQSRTHGWDMHTLHNFDMTRRQKSLRQRADSLPTMPMAGMNL